MHLLQCKIGAHVQCYVIMSEKLIQEFSLPCDQPSEVCRDYLARNRVILQLGLKVKCKCYYEGLADVVFD